MVFVWVFIVTQLPYMFKTFLNIVLKQLKLCFGFNQNS